MQASSTEETVQKGGAVVNAVGQARKVFRIHKQDDGLVDRTSTSKDSIDTISLGRRSEPVPQGETMSGDVSVLPGSSSDWLYLKKRKM
jgi:hypothetical protein